MKPQSTSTFPGGSKSRINKAGSAIARDNGSPEDLRAFEEWRAAHRGVLNTFQAILRTRAKNKGVTVAQRHKRKVTILDKLHRHKGMSLARMDDVAGCRLIFETLDDLTDFRTSMHKARFRHLLKNEESKYNYIKTPKGTGYRGIHDVYEYDVNSTSGESLRGLLVEIQYRTLIQHSWATAVEVIGLITKSQPKFERGDSRYTKAMSYASEILARAHEGCKGPFPDIDNRELLARFEKLNKDLRLLQMLKGVKVADEVLTTGGDIILIFKKDGTLEIRGYRSAPSALLELFNLEDKLENEDVVLVRGATSHDVRLAYQNYFGDTSDFIQLVSDGIKILSPSRKRINEQNQVG